MNADSLTLVIRQAFSFLVYLNPKGTSLGIVFGVIIDGGIGVFSPFLRRFDFINLDNLRIWHLISVGIILGNLKHLFTKNTIDPKIKNVIEYIEDQKNKGIITDNQARRMYKLMLDKVIDNVVKNQNSMNSEETISN